MLKSFTKDIVTYMPSKLLPAFTGFITAPILTRLFLPEEYASYALAKGVADFLFAMAASGIASVPVRFLPAYESESEQQTFMMTLLVSTLILVAGVAVLGGAALFLLRDVVASDLVPLFTISLGVFAGEAVFIVFMQVVRAQMRSGMFTLFELLNRYGSLVLGLLLVIVFGFTIEGLLWGEVLAFVLILPPLIMVSLRGIKPRARHLRKQAAGRIWQYAWPLAIGNTAMWGLRLSDRYVISIFRPDSEVGLYAMAYNLSAKSIDLLVALFLLTMAPMVVHAWESEGREATEETITMVTRLFLILCLPAAIGLTVLARPFMALLTTSAYQDGARIVGFIAFSSLAWGLAQIAGRGLLIQKRTGKVAVSQGIAAAVNMGLNLLLVPRFGFVMAGAANLVGFSLLVGLQAYASRKYLTWRFPFTTLWRVLASASVMALSVTLFHGLGGFGEREAPGILWLFLSMGVGAVVYFAALLLFQEIREEERAWALRFMHRLGVRIGVLES